MQRIDPDHAAHNDISLGMNDLSADIFVLDKSLELVLLSERNGVYGKVWSRKLRNDTKLKTLVGSLEPFESICLS